MKKVYPKRILCALLALALLCPILTAEAQTPFIFVAVENSLKRDMTDANMPVWIDGTLYIDYEILSDLLDLRTYYNTTMQQVLFYNFDSRITFDLANSQTYDLDGEFYSLLAIRRSGTIFVPIRMICDHFDFYYSYVNYSDMIAPMLRINSGDPVASDSMFVDGVTFLMDLIYNNYLSSLPQPEPDPDPEPQPEPEPEPEPEPAKLTYFAMYGIEQQFTSSMLDLFEIHGYRTAIFVTEQQILQNADLVRRAHSLGHPIGLALDPSGDIEQQLTLGAAALRAVLRTDTRLVNIAGGVSATTEKQRESIISSGYRMWDIAMPQQGFDSADGAYDDARDRLNEQEGTVVLGISPTLFEHDALPDILAYVQSGNFSVLNISVWSTPINDANDIR